VSSGTVAGLDITATRSENGDTLMINVVNINGSPIKTVLSVLGFSGASGVVKTYTLSGALNAENTLADPEKIKTVESSLQGNVDSISYSFPACSYTILRYLPLVSETSHVHAGTTLKVIPNPANDHITIEHCGAGGVTIFDINGKVAMTTKSAYNNAVDISGLSNGCYYVRATDHPAWPAVKFLKN